MNETISRYYSGTLLAALAMSAMTISAVAEKGDFPDGFLTPETPMQVVRDGSGQEWKAQLSVSGAGNLNRQSVVLSGPDGKIFSLPSAPRDGNQLVFHEVLEIAQDGGLVSVITRRNIVSPPQQGQPVGFDGCRRQYRWWLFVTVPETLKQGFEPGKPLDESLPLMILGGLQLEADNRPSMADGLDKNRRVVARMQSPRRVEVEVTDGDRKIEHNVIEWNWKELKVNGEIRKTFGGWWQPYVDPERARREISAAADQRDLGALVPSKVSRVLADVGGLDNARLRLGQFARSNADVEMCMEILLAKKALEDADSRAWGAAEPERLRALVEEEKRKEEARRQKVREMDAKADQLDRELSEQARRDNQRKQKQREEEMAE